MRTLVLLSAVLALTVGLNCYIGSYPKGSAPTSGSLSTKACSNTCVKTMASVSGAQAATYGCGDGVCDIMSISNGKCKTQKANGASATTCCCTGDFCNSSGLARISAVVVLMLSALAM